MKMNDLAANAETIEFKLNGETISAFAGETIIQAAARHGVEIPRLCYKEGYRPDGNCRACVVEIAGERVLAPSCCRAVTPGMDVKARSERAVKSQKLVVEMLLADLPERGYKWTDGAPLIPALAQAATAGEHRFDGVSGPLPGEPAAAPAGQHGELSAWADLLGVVPRPELVALRREQPAADVSHPA